MNTAASRTPSIGAGPAVLLALGGGSDLRGHRRAGDRFVRQAELRGDVVPPSGVVPACDRHGYGEPASEVPSPRRARGPVKSTDQFRRARGCLSNRFGRRVAIVSYLVFVGSVVGGSLAASAIGGSLAGRV